MFPWKEVAMNPRVEGEFADSKGEVEKLQGNPRERKGTNEITGREADVGA